MTIPRLTLHTAGPDDPPGTPAPVYFDARSISALLDAWGGGSHGIEGGVGSISRDALAAGNYDPNPGDSGRVWLAFRPAGGAYRLELHGDGDPAEQSWSAWITGVPGAPVATGAPVAPNRMGKPPGSGTAPAPKPPGSQSAGGASSGMLLGGLAIILGLLLAGGGKG